MPRGSRNAGILIGEQKMLKKILAFFIDWFHQTSQ